MIQLSYKCSQPTEVKLGTKLQLQTSSAIKDIIGIAGASSVANLAKPADIENMGRIKAISGHKISDKKDKNKTVIECRAGQQKFIQIKIKNKSEFDWPADGLTWSNDYYVVLENVPRLEKFQEMIMTISFIVPKSFVGVQGQKSENI